MTLILDEFNILVIIFHLLRGALCRQLRSLIFIHRTLYSLGIISCRDARDSEGSSESQGSFR
jgi:hypothetical protein